MPDLLKGWLRIETSQEKSVTELPGPEDQAVVVQAINDIITR
jgi:hypothetical protein